MKIERLTSLLTYAGAIPFAVALVLEYSQTKLWGLDGGSWFITYGLVIVSFMAGSVWGHSLLHAERKRRPFILISTNVLTLVAWFVYMLAPPMMSLAINGLALLALAGLELRWSGLGTVADYYLMLRARITLVVLVMHAVMLAII
ncbi:DUF3429 domain-containing protein [Bermanella marisrubri]|uniref:DUF3429 domain-containing protein n=1 Tax=Bermanella marisrubri TaxID=207949 RepID=Q1MZB8_9GAMM|nr:DUF3429 domain-containing protein [Bermanella marisrubri]EAT11348.1 hypothetical protein RED65_13012 [Oceanobacter sp. RED65] [Bermanella marisrubri]QIZ85265.1 DUF3429 domain-containing protein [Bermanella marisrubri]